MTDLTLAQSHEYYFGPLIGLNHFFFTLNFHIVIHTWIVILLILLIAFLVRLCTLQKNLVQHTIFNATHSLYVMLEQSIGYCKSNHFYFIATLFLYISFCNLASLIPGLEEPTQNINTTFSLGIISFLYIQYAAIKKVGFLHYIKGEFLTPLFLFPLHVVGKLASILSISLRLFGNIFGGSIISKIYFSAIQYSFFNNPVGIMLQLCCSAGMTVVVTMFFTIIEGLLQAFVFTMLTITYLAIAIRDDSGH